MGKGGSRLPGPLGQAFHLGRQTLKRPGILKNLKLQVLEKATEAWDQVEAFVEPAKLKTMLEEIYRSERWSDANKDDKKSNKMDPKNARLPHATREKDALRPKEMPTLRLKDPKVSFENGLLNGTASFVLELPTAFPKKFDSPTPIKVTIKSPKFDRRQLTVEGRATAAGKIIRINFKVELHYDPMDVVKAAVAIAKDEGIEKETLEKLLSKIRIDISSFGYVLILPTWNFFSASSLLPVDRPLHGTKDRLLPIQLGALPNSSLLNLGLIAVPSGVFFDTPAAAGGAHWSKFGSETGFSLTGGVIAKPNLDQIGKSWGKAFSLYGYADLFYVKRFSKTVDVGLGLTYAIDVFGDRAKPKPAHLNYLKAKHQPWLPGSRENVGPSDDRSGQRLMFRLEGTHDLLGS